MLFRCLAAARAVAVTAAGGRKDACKRTVFIKTEEQSDDNGKPATAENVGAEDTVLRAQHEQGDKDPKGYVITLIATSHKKPPVFRRRGYV